MNQLFFCTGLPKSGTTFLQRTLNLHPEVSCPSEHQFDALSNGIEQLLRGYDGVLGTVDRRTGGQGFSPIGPLIYKSMFQHAVKEMIRVAAAEKPIAGANDNTIISNLELYNELFDSPKLVVIFRNPLDRALSAWKHNMRLAKEENDPKHAELMTRHGSVEEWCVVAARGFSKAVDALTKFQQTHDNVIVVRYEDLVENKRPTIERLFGFLGASVTPEVLQFVEVESSLNSMKSVSSKKDFFGPASTAGGKGRVPDDVRNRVATVAAEALCKLNYEHLVQ